MARHCKVCLGPLRPDGTCLYKCDPQLAKPTQRRAAVERREALKRAVAEESRIGLSIDEVNAGVARVRQRVPMVNPWRVAPRR